jgi:2-desacetyl-2-hydroxyethyl bacteriochlorophyllide A dehydrogenase
VRAVVIPAIGRIELRDVPEPVVEPGRLIVEVGACGVCGTDLHILQGEFIATYPCIPGHEFAGTVVAAAPDVSGFGEGDRVAVMPSVFCGSCHFCRTGRANLCESGGGFGTSMPGAYAERVSVLATHAYHIPDALTFAEGALIEPLACVVHGFDRLRPHPGDSYLIYGAGTMGLMLAQFARFAGARTVALVDINPAKLDRARTFGFDVLGASFESVRDAAPSGFDNVIEATGVVSVAETAFGSVIRGGRLLLFGVYSPGKAAFEAYQIFNREIDILGSMAVHNSFQTALDAMLAGAIDARRMVSHTFPLERFEDALETLRRGEGMKVQIAPNG